MQQTCLLCRTADMSGVSHHKNVCCVTQQTCLRCDTTGMSAVRHSRHVCCVTRQTCSPACDSKERGGGQSPPPASQERGGGHPPPHATQRRSSVSQTKLWTAINHSLLDLTPALRQKLRIGQTSTLAYLSAIGLGLDPNSRSRDLNFI